MRGRIPWNKGQRGLTSHKVSEETRAKISAANRGRKPSPQAIARSKEVRLAKAAMRIRLLPKQTKSTRKPLTEKHRARLRELRKGATPWNKGLSGYYKLSDETRAKMRGRTPWNKGRRGLWTHSTSEETKAKISLANKGRKPKPQTVAAVRLANSGKHLSAEHKAKIARYGERNHLWKGGITPENARIRTSKEYKEWRLAVFTRDDFTCQHCGKRGGTLHADHIRDFAKHKHLRMDPSNGRTLCVPCHQNTETYPKNLLGRKRKTINDLA